MNHVLHMPYKLNSLNWNPIKLCKIDTNEETRYAQYIINGTLLTELIWHNMNVVYSPQGVHIPFQMTGMEPRPSVQWSCLDSTLPACQPLPPFQGTTPGIRKWSRHIVLNDSIINWKDMPLLHARWAPYRTHLICQISITAVALGNDLIWFTLDVLILYELCMKSWWILGFVWFVQFSASYLSNCIQSWRGAFSSPVSMNAITSMWNNVV